MAQTMSEDDIMQHIQRAAPFIEGITVSGGEATTQLPFLCALFARVKATPELRSLTCLVDSNGELSRTGWERLAPCSDGVMIDLKAWDDDVHRALTGRGNGRIKDSIRWLAEQGLLTELRLLLIPGRSDYIHNIEPLSAFIRQLGEVPVRLNAFHVQGVYGDAKEWRSAGPDDIETLAEALQTRGITKIILPALYL